MEFERLADVSRFDLSEAAEGAMVATTAASTCVRLPGSPARVMTPTLLDGLTRVGANQESGRPGAVDAVRAVCPSNPGLCPRRSISGVTTELLFEQNPPRNTLHDL